jgi:hypothetical protein
MKAIELLETYPKAATVIKEFYYEKMINSLQEDNDIPQEFKDMVKAQQFDSEYIATFIDNNPRFLFDIFDANKIYIGVVPNQLIGGMEFKYTIGEISGEKPTRKEVEMVAVEKAFEILNDKL